MVVQDVADRGGDDGGEDSVIAKRDREEAASDPSASYDDWTAPSAQGTNLVGFGGTAAGAPTELGTPLRAVLARLSSTITGGNAKWCGASRCIDGDTTTRRHCSDGTSMCHSAMGQANPWLEVDLGDAVDLWTVQIFNRLDCCFERLASFEIWRGASQTS